MLSDTVTLTGTATVVEAYNVSLEITNAEIYQAGTNGGGVIYNPTYEISQDKKSFTFSMGEITVDEDGVICDVSNLGEASAGAVEEYFCAVFKLTVTNKSNVPVELSTSSVYDGIKISLHDSLADDDYTVIDDYLDGEVLASGASCSFYVDIETSEVSYESGDNLTATFTITGTEYTGAETPSETHTHISASGW